MARTVTRRLTAGELRWRCDPDSLGFETTDDLDARHYIIGQDRALDAIRLGLEMKSKGYNIYISGPAGSGRTMSIRQMLEGMDRRTTELKDICFVHNFRSADIPRCLELPAGKGCRLKTEMKNALRLILAFIPEVLRSERFKEKQSIIRADVQKREHELTRGLQQDIADHGFSIVEADYGRFTRPEIAPVVGGSVVTMEDLPRLLVEGKLGRGDYEKMQTSYPELVERLEGVLLERNSLHKEFEDKMRQLERDHIKPMITVLLGSIRSEFKYPKVVEYLAGIEEFVIDNLELFYAEEVSEDGAAGQPSLLPFEINVVVDNSQVKEAPVVFETTTSFISLFGTIERTIDQRGNPASDHMAIRAGSLHQANGGYLVVNLNDLFDEPYVWATFRRATKNQSHSIRGLDSFMWAAMTGLKPEEIALDVKVVLIGDPHSYQVLYEYDDDFRGTFRVKSEFDNVMPRSKTNIRKYCHFFKTVIEGESLLPLHKSGAAALVEEGVRKAGRKNKLTTSFGQVGDMVREANYWAKKERARAVRAAHIERAVKERIRRANLYEEKLQEMFENGTILLDTRGTVVGQVNGLAVFDLGDHSFGKPSRITAEAGVGRAGVINIERESDMSGRIHNKGMLILEGYMRRMYAQDKPITMTASICFEQAYSGIDGDSASSTEVYALVSSLSGIGMRQDIAVTGSVNQKGEIQPIGGVNEKIEGFFDVCAHGGLSGSQGVMIPSLNRSDLMLRADVVEAVRKGKFHIYTARTIDDGIEILSGHKAGRRRKRGGFPKDSVHYHVDSALRHFHDQLRNAEDGGEDDDRVPGAAVVEKSPRLVLARSRRKKNGK